MAVKKICEIFSGKQYIEDFGWAVTYGIAYKRMQTVLAMVEDISSNYEFVSNLADKILNGDVADIHFKDVIEDALI
ncbi:hypothetical protein SDC9_140579 [bioreactor metagenome]|uniref:Uncharacterized protein n=1 Tax=bioreactor metagenome TaxID=1076179 RepID=A0A645DYM8_9ZZZZ